jgi:hypothetical protein
VGFRFRAGDRVADRVHRRHLRMVAPIVTYLQDCDGAR